MDITRNVHEKAKAATMAMALANGLEYHDTDKNVALLDFLPIETMLRIGVLDTDGEDTYIVTEEAGVSDALQIKTNLISLRQMAWREKVGDRLLLRVLMKSAGSRRLKLFRSGLPNEWPVYMRDRAEPLEDRVAQLSKGTLFSAFLPQHTIHYKNGRLINQGGASFLGLPVGTTMTLCRGSYNIGGITITDRTDIAVAENGTLSGNMYVQGENAAATKWLNTNMMMVGTEYLIPNSLTHNGKTIVDLTTIEVPALPSDHMPDTGVGIYKYEPLRSKSGGIEWSSDLSSYIDEFLFG